MVARNALNRGNKIPPFRYTCRMQEAVRGHTNISHSSQCFSSQLGRIGKGKRRCRIDVALVFEHFRATTELFHSFLSCWSASLNLKSSLVWNCCRQSEGKFWESFLRGLLIGWFRHVQKISMRQFVFNTRIDVTLVFEHYRVTELFHCVLSCADAESGRRKGPPLQTSPNLKSSSPRQEFRTLLHSESSHILSSV